jgi:hypothetical protein
MGAEGTPTLRLVTRTRAPGHDLGLSVWTVVFLHASFRYSTKANQPNFKTRRVSNGTFSILQMPGVAVDPQLVGDSRRALCRPAVEVDPTWS